MDEFVTLSVFRSGRLNICSVSPALVRVSSVSLGFDSIHSISQGNQSVNAVDSFVSSMLMSAEGLTERPG